jgi:hypothetical protein
MAYIILCLAIFRNGIINGCSLKRRRYKRNNGQRNDEDREKKINE